MLKFRVVLFAVMLVAPSSGFGQLPKQRLLPLREVLNPDGTINTAKGFSGSLDPSGWQLVNKANGEPRFIESVPADSLWDDRFAPRGTVTLVSAMTAAGTDLYLGGQLLVGGVATRNLVRWDGANWSPVGTPVTVGDMLATVYAIAVMGTDVYVGGVFSEDGVYGSNKVKKWNGSSWTVLTNPDNAMVFALAVVGSDVYAGGSFSSIGGVPANSIARWNGATWNALGSGVIGDVSALAVRGTDLYVGGAFVTAGGVSANHIAKWNGSTWTALGSGMNSDVSCIAADEGAVYAGGTFTTAGGGSANHVARWDGSNWSALGTGTGGTYSRVYALAIIGTNLYVGGEFTTAGGLATRGIACWDGTNWTSSLGAGLQGAADWEITSVRGIVVSGTSVFVSGSFSGVSGVVANNVARWNGSSWSALSVPPASEGIVGYPQVIACGGNTVYAAGMLTGAGGVLVNKVARWDGSNWSALGSGISGGTYSGVYALAIKGTDLYVGGEFTHAGGLTANNIARWNGTSWTSMGTINGPVSDLAINGTDVIACGSFTTAGGVSANNIARWNGTAWSAMGGGMDGSVYALAVSGTNIFAGGSFSTAGGVSATNIARWDGSGWSALGGGVSGTVYAIAVSGATVYAGGQNGTLGWISRWNGSSWSGLPGLSSYSSYWSVRSIAVRGNEVFVGGENITSPGYCLGKYNGSSWSALGSSILYGTAVSCLAVNGGNVYVGGDFRLAGDKPANMISRWLGPPVVTPTLTRGSVGMPLIITGGEFDPVPSNNLVRFGAISAVVLSAGLNTLTVMVPPGAVTGTISVTTRNLTGVSSSSFAIWPAGFAVSPSSLTFSPTAIGDSTRDTVVVRNPSLGGLYVASVVSTNPRFTITPSSGIVASGDSLKFTVSFTPTGANPENGSIVFFHNSPSSPDTVDVMTFTSALAAGDYTIGLSLFQRITGRRLEVAQKVRTVSIQVPSSVSNPKHDNPGSGRGAPLREEAPTTDRVTREQRYGVLTEHGVKYAGPFFAPVSRADRERAGLPSSVLGVYPTITAALADLDTTGLLGHVRFLLADSLYPTETFPLDVKVSAPYYKPGSSATITLKPDVGVSPRIVGLSPTDDPILRVRADYVTIDGSNTGGGITRDLAITNYNGVAVALSVWDMINFPDDTVSYVTVKNTILTDTTGGSGTLTVGPPFAYAGGRFSDITIENNEVHGGKFGMWISGMEMNPGSNVIVRNNIVQGVHGIGIIAKYSDGVQISGNDLGNFVPVLFGYLEGIRAELGATNVMVERNVVHDLGDSAPGLPGGNGIVVMTFDSLPNVLVRNNLIYGMTGSGSSFYWTDNPIGIRIQAPAGGVKVYNNSISLSGNTLGEANALSTGIGVGSGARPDLRNNIIVNNLGLAGGAGIGSCGVYFQDTTNLATTLDHNLYYVNPSGSGVNAIGMIDTSPSVTLASWQSATGQETHGMVGDPLFVSATDLHVSGPGSPAGNAGGSLGDVTRDFDNQTRSTLSPDIGADEFAPIPAGVAVAVQPGWNMLSNPIVASNDSVTQLYPGSAFGYAFSFTSAAGYQQSYRMEHGKGYWAKLVSGGTQTLLGPARTEDSVTVSAGWNMVGSISYPVDTAAVTSVPPGIRTSQWYGFGPGYSPSAEIAPGKAYWVKANAAGKFFFSLSPGPPSQAEPAGRDILAGLNTLTITDAAGASQTLYFGPETKAPLRVEMFEMPPAPPSGALDARFSTTGGGTLPGGSMVQTHDGRGGSFPITLRGGQYPLTVSWQMKQGGDRYTLRDGIGGGTAVEGDGTWRITSNSVSRLVLKTASGEEIPEEFALFQNYPNPFNPSTTIKFALPVAGRVSLDIFNVLGQRVRSLLNDDRPEGYPTVEWNGTGDAGQQLGSGVYFVRLTAAALDGRNFTDVRKLILMK
jgi:hypothetical protein